VISEVMVIRGTMNSKNNFEFVNQISLPVYLAAKIKKKTDMVEMPRYWKISINRISIISVDASSSP